MQHVEIHFYAVLEDLRIDSATIDLTPTFPKIRVVQLEDGEHEFTISKRTDGSSAMVNAAIEEAKLQIDHFWSLLAFLRDTIIRPLPTIKYSLNGETEQYNKGEASVSLSMIASFGLCYFERFSSAFQAEYDLDLVKRLNFARSNSDPIARFVSLYALLLSCCGEDQAAVDREILKFDSSTAVSVQPRFASRARRRERRLETIYTRLRNELAHARPGVSVFSTYNEIVTHVVRFEYIVKGIVTPKCKINGEDE